MKKILLSVAVATMALSTTVSALEDIKVTGDAKVWYETDNAEQAGTPGDMFNKTDASAEVVFKLGMTGKQGDVGFGAQVTQGSTMGLEHVLVNGVRTNTSSIIDNTGSVAVGTEKNQGDMYVSKVYITAPVAPDTIVKLGRQELNTPFAFTEKWNAQQNNFDAAVFINSSVSDLTIIGAYVGQTNTAGSFKATQEFNQIGVPFGGNGAFALAALYKNDSLAVNAWAYELPSIAKAFWVDAGMSVGPVALKAYIATMMPSDSLATTLGMASIDDTLGFALSASTKVSGWNLSAAASMIGEDGTVALGNVATNFKKTKLPTAGVYTDGLYVAQPDSTAFKVKAAGKVGETGLVLQAVNNTNGTDDTKDTTEIDLIVSQKVGAFNLKGIVMHRMFSDDATDNAAGGQYVRAIVGVNF